MLTGEKNRAQNCLFFLLHAIILMTLTKTPPHEWGGRGSWCGHCPLSRFLVWQKPAKWFHKHIDDRKRVNVSILSNGYVHSFLTPLMWRLSLTLLGIQCFVYLLLDYLEPVWEFNASSRALFTALIMPTEDSVAPETVSTAVPLAAVMASSIAFSQEA